MTDPAPDVYIPDEGHIVFTNFDPAAGHEQKGHRPAVVLSKRAFNQPGLMIAVPMTTKVRGMPFEVPMKSYHAERGSVALANQVTTMDYNDRTIKHVGRASTDELYQIRYIVRTFIGFVPSGYTLPSRS
jgi:mRNA interferase MazF